VAARLQRHAHAEVAARHAWPLPLAPFAEELWRERRDAHEFAPGHADLH
jgi:hypothetical protein